MVIKPNKFKEEYESLANHLADQFESFIISKLENEQYSFWGEAIRIDIPKKDIRFSVDFLCSDLYAHLADPQRNKRVYSAVDILSERFKNSGWNRVILTAGMELSYFLLEW